MPRPNPTDPESAYESLRTFALFGGVLSALSPLLQSLTQSFASDTLFALVTVFAAVHLFSHDYDFINKPGARFNGTLSLNSAIFLSVLLASRLQSSDQAFALVFFGIEVFAFLVHIQRRVRLRAFRAFVAASGLLFFLLCFLLRRVSVAAVVTYATVIFIVTVIAPFMILRVRGYKWQISGPWDIARVESVEE